MISTWCWYISCFKAAIPSSWTLTDVFLPAHFLEDVDLLCRGISDLLDLLRAHLIWWRDVYDFDGIFLSGALMDAASNHTAYPSATQTQSNMRNTILSIDFWRKYYIVEYITHGPMKCHEKSIVQNLCWKPVSTC